MTEEMRKASSGSGQYPGEGGRATNTDEILATSGSGAARDMREILASIRKLMKETSAPEPGPVPEERRRVERARRFETVQPPPRAEVDEWPDDPEIDVDALADELLRMAGSLAQRRAAALEKKVGADAALPGDCEATPSEIGESREGSSDAWGELDALLSYAEKALDIGTLDDEPASASAPPSQMSSTHGAGDLVAFPTPEHVDPSEAMPDLSEVLRSAEPLNPDEIAASTQTPSPSQETGAAEGGADEPDTVPAPPPADDRVPAPAPSDGSVEALDLEDPPEETVEKPQNGAPDVAQIVEPEARPGSAEKDVGGVGAPDEPAETAEVAAPDILDAGEPAPAPAPASAPVAVPAVAPAPPPPSVAPVVAAAMPDDPRNLPSAQNVNILDKIGKMVRAQAEENLRSGQSTYSGKDPHPRIVEKTGWSRGGPRRGDAEQAEEAPKPPVTSTDLALRALEQDDPAVDAASEGPAIAPMTLPAGDPAHALRPLFADWLDENFARLMEDLVKERMARMADEKGSGQE